MNPVAVIFLIVRKKVTEHSTKLSAPTREEHAYMLRFGHPEVKFRFLDFSRSCPILLPETYCPIKIKA